MRRHSIVAVLAAAVLTLGACGGDSDDQAGATASLASASAVTTTASTVNDAVANKNLEGVGEMLDTSLLNRHERSRVNITAGPPAEYGQPGDKDYLIVRAMGKASDPGGLWFYGRGFTPGGSCTITAAYPVDSVFEGVQYTYVACEPIQDDGSLTAKRWNPYETDPNAIYKGPDPDGIFGFTIKDDVTGNAVTVKFLIVK